jgi:hypothetical protein
VSGGEGGEVLDAGGGGEAGGPEPGLEAELGGPAAVGAGEDSVDLGCRGLEGPGPGQQRDGGSGHGRTITRPGAGNIGQVVDRRPVGG